MRAITTARSRDLCNNELGRMLSSVRPLHPQNKSLIVAQPVRLEAASTPSTCICVFSTRSVRGPSTLAAWAYVCAFWLVAWHVSQLLYTALYTPACLARSGCYASAGPSSLSMNLPGASAHVAPRRSCCHEQLFHDFPTFAVLRAQLPWLLCRLSFIARCLYRLVPCSLSELPVASIQSQPVPLALPSGRRMHYDSLTDEPNSGPLAVLGELQKDIARENRFGGAAPALGTRIERKA